MLTNFIGTLVIVISLLSIVFVAYFMYFELFDIDEIILETIGHETLSFSEIRKDVASKLVGGKYLATAYTFISLPTRLEKLCDSGYLERYKAVGDAVFSIFGVEFPQYHYKKSTKRPPRKRVKATMFNNLDPFPS